MDRFEALKRLNAEGLPTLYFKEDGSLSAFGWKIWINDEGMLRLEMIDFDPNGEQPVVKYRYRLVEDI